MIGLSHVDFEAGVLACHCNAEAAAPDLAEAGIRIRLQPLVSLPEAFKECAVSKTAGALPVPLVLHPLTCTWGVTALPPRHATAATLIPAL